MASKTAIIASCAAVAVLCGCVLLANSNRIHLKHGLRSAHVSAPAARGRVASISKRCAPAAAAARLSKMPMQTTASSSKIAGRKFALAPLRSSSTDSEPASSSGLVVIPEDYRLGGSLLGVAFLLGPALHLWPQFFLHALIGGFLTFQTTRVRFRFSDSDLDVVFTDGPEGSSAESVSTASSGENMLQGGGENKWSLKSVTNWEMWWPGFPILVYFKENQTKSDGQPHFFPIIMDGKKLYEQMLAKMGPSKNTKPAPEDWNLDTALDATPVGRRIKEELDGDIKAKLKEVKDFADIAKLFQS